jgi:hypothetical protein
MRLESYKHAERSSKDSKIDDHRRSAQVAYRWEYKITVAQVRGNEPIAYKPREDFDSLSQIA